MREKYNDFNCRDVNVVRIAGINVNGNLSA